MPYALCPMPYAQSYLIFLIKAINPYELHNGAIVEIPQATGEPSEVADFLYLKLEIQIERLGLPYLVPKECVV